MAHSFFTATGVGFRFCGILLPKAVSDEEVIVRAIFSPYHLKSGGTKLKRDAFFPSPSTDEISVMRSSFLSSDACKRKARELESPTHKKEFKGFAVLNVGDIRGAELDVVDSRIEFLGHGDIRTGVSGPPKGTPCDPDLRERIDQISSSLLGLSRFVEDPDPSAARWLGPGLTPDD